MAKPDGTPWKFYVVIRKDDRTYVRHDSLMKAMDEAQRLCKEDKATFNVLGLVGRFDVAYVPVIWREPSRD